MKTTITEIHRLPFFLLSSMIVLILISCATTGSHQATSPEDGLVEESQYYVPQAVDSTIAKDAFLEMVDLFVSIEREKEAQIQMEAARKRMDLYTALNQLITIEDSSESDESFLMRINQLDTDLSLKIRLGKHVKNQGLKKTVIMVKQENWKRLLEAKTMFEHGCALNPFDIHAKMELSQVYIHLGKGAESDKMKSDYFLNGLSVLQNILSIDKGSHYTYYRIAEVHMHQENWKEANENFKKAYQTLRAFEFLPKNLYTQEKEIAVDSSTVFKYLLGIIQSYIKLRDSMNGLKAIDQAILFSQNESNLQILDDFKDMINWAGGDIYARELFVEAENHYQNRDYHKAAEKYHDVLGRTKREAETAYLETSYLLSMMEYKYLKSDKKYIKKYHRENIGMNRLRRICQQIPKDMSGAPKDTALMNYFDILGTMLFNEGIGALESRERVRAFLLFYQGAVLYSGMRAKCCLELTKLTVNHGEFGLRWALLTYGIRDQLNSEEMSQLYRLLRFVTKRANNPILCRYFQTAFQEYLSGEPEGIDRKNLIMVYEFLRSVYEVIDRDLWERFDMRQNQAVINQYTKQYRDNERRLPAVLKETLHREIESIYLRMQNSRLIDEWNAFRDTNSGRE